MSQEPAAPTSPRRVAPVVALTLLEVIREQDLPSEVFGDEDPQVTMPRRLGLSDVVERQIRRYRDDVRSGSKATDDEIRDLIGLVIRRPDSEEVFFMVGEQLAGTWGRNRPGLRRFLPDAVAFALARKRIQRKLNRLFGRRIGGFGEGPFTLEGRALLFIQSDPGGDACQLVSGFCQAILRGYAGRPVWVIHSACESRKHESCRWTVVQETRAPAPALKLETGRAPEAATG